MHAIQKPAIEKILEKGLQISEHMLLCMMWSTQYMLPGHIPHSIGQPHSNGQERYKTFQLGTIKNVCSVYILFEMCIVIG